MKIIQWVYTLYSGLVFIFLMLIFGLFIVIPLLISKKGGRISFIFIHLWASTWFFLSGIRCEIHGREFIDINQPYIYIFNHRSFIDAPIIPVAIQQEVRAIGKKELSKIPIFGFITSRVAVWVDRKDTESRKASVARLLGILNKGISIVVAPEGTRNDTDKKLLPFQKGAFRIAVETAIPIMPMAVIGADEIMKKGSILLKPGKIKVYFSSPIDPNPYQYDEGHLDLSEHCFNHLEGMLKTNL
jgi:1-acyl-sn-glycerol-3-phosphate acyltransferase